MILYASRVVQNALGSPACICKKNFSFKLKDMKKVLLLMFWALVLICGVSVYANNKDVMVAEKSSSQKVYYVVLGSYNTLEGAQKFNYMCPDGMECWIYKCTSKGKTVYRVCFSCFSTRQKAQAEINEWRSLGSHLFTNAWIWESEGLGNCVFCPDNYETEMTMPPLSPK